MKCECGRDLLVHKYLDCGPALPVRNQKGEQVDSLGFGQALAAMRAGKRVRRGMEAWPDPRIWGYWWLDFEQSRIMTQYGGSPCPSSDDILATDWQVVE